MEEYVMAIDIGSTKIAAFLGRLVKGKIYVEEHHHVTSQGVLRGEVANTADTILSIKTCLAGLHEKLRKKNIEASVSSVVVGIAGRHVESFPYTLSNVRENPNARITERELKSWLDKVNTIPFKAGSETLKVFERNFLVDNRLVSKAVGCVGTSLKVNYLAITGNVEAIRRIEDCIGKCELTISKKMLEPAASADAVLSSEEVQQGVALLDIGGGTSDMVIYYDGKVHNLCVIPCGGCVITRDIMEVCGLAYQQADWLKCEHGGCLESAASDQKKFSLSPSNGFQLSERLLARIIQSRMEEILDAVRYTIEQSGCKEHVKNIVLTGGGAHLKNLPQLVALRTGCNVRVGYPTVQMTARVGNNKLDPEFATAVGLLMNAPTPSSRIERLIHRISLLGLPFLDTMFDPDAEDKTYIS